MDIGLYLKIYRFKLWINDYAWKEPVHHRRKVTGIAWNNKWIWDRQRVVKFRD
jgi:hypothetical protein